ncbi:hypothetical protein ACFSUJ_20550 [Streptomyces lusitanus]|uniref:hypothetical protein n=1 Tax=Streptomyces lusitanus TaxID=68232 RepID=UPI003615392C
MPVIDSPDEAARDIPLTVLSAALHRRDPGADAILNALAKALKGLSADDENTATTFIELTEQGLGTTRAADLWRHLMAVDLSFFQSQTAQQLRAEGRAEDLLVLLGHRGVEVSEADHERIVDCGDPDVLGLWFRRALTATSTAEIFASDGEAGAEVG